MASIIGPRAARLDLVIEQGATFNVTMTWKDSTGTAVAGLDNWSARMYLKTSKSESSTVLELTTANGGVVLGDNPGEVKLFISDSDTAAMTDVAGVYDLELISPSSVVTRLLAGKWKLDTEVTDD